jgi:SAM-dependent methyltransferase
MTNDVGYPSSYFQRYDPTDDALFYDLPRKVVHIDDGAIAALGEIYAELLPTTGTLLDLMSSWRSHLPTAVTESPLLQVVGLGMNAEEMAENPQLARFVIHDLNREPRLPFEAGVFTAAVCAVSVQYLTRPIEVFRDVARVLAPGGRFVVSFSNRCFPTKAVAVWQATSDEQHVQLVGSYFRMAGGWDEPEGRARQPDDGDPLFVVWARKSGAAAERPGTLP